MEIIKRTIVCDACGKEVIKSNFKNSKLYMQTLSWGGGSMGGDEDHREIYADLCEDCCLKIEEFLTKKMKIKLVKYKSYSHHIVKA
ncbi:MAG: hypothetical protein MJZ30_05865 [Paludibacteraceae bacterium]|nr:hypothetical protein [Paludibacteraceae bacterium]